MRYLTVLVTCLSAMACLCQDLAHIPRTPTIWGAEWECGSTASPVTLRRDLDKAALEVERAGHDGSVERQAEALVELGNVQHALGDIENAVRNSMRAVSLATGAAPDVRRKAVLQLASIHLDAGHAERALELLQEMGPVALHERSDRRRYLRLQAEAMSRTLPPADLIAQLNGPVSEAVKNGDDALQAELLALLAKAYTKQGGTLRAIELEERIMGIALKQGNTTQAGISANNLAELLRGTAREGETTELYQRALILLDDRPDLKLGTMMNSALQLALTNQLELAYRTLEEANRLALSTDNARGVALVQRTRAALQLREGEFERAFESATQALRSAAEANSDAEQARACDLLATIAERQGNSVAARSFQKRSREHEAKANTQQEQFLREHAADLARWQRMEREQIESMNRQQRQHSEMRQLALDADNQEKRVALLMAEKQLEEGARREESMARARAQQDLALTMAALDAERSGRMIQDLENTRLLQSMSMDRLSMERKQREAEMERLEQQNEMAETRSRALEAERSTQLTMQYGSIAVAFLMLVFGGYMTWAWNTARRKKRTIWRQKQQIEGINEELAAKNQDIESSLRYAQTIQSAILPSENDLQQYLPESFLLYKPLDKVSGDLPFVLRSGNSLYVAAIDCTGHGVPAGMMTFIAYYGLSDLIKQYAHESCGRLLDRLHKHVKQTMDSRVNGGLYNDGMDIGLCRIDLDSGKLNFSGAQLSLVLLRQGCTTRLKGDLLPLGDDQFERKTGYMDHDMKLEQGDRLFLFSDGIIHQFGGTDGRKKFSLRRLNELLEANAAMELPELKIETEKWFNEWKGDTPQTDDVLMIGLSYAA
ncbi:MAG: SpoIIE family protein phosphatase [Flavobacteriales bacterium]|nr:SpoIIE family protein phosphatase [Flavobacteriales bacterium]